jgi:uncharacterized protein
VRVVLDTNVALSLYAFTNSQFAPIRAAGIQNKLEFYTDDHCFAEYVRVLNYKQIKLSVEQQKFCADAYRNEVEWVSLVTDLNDKLPLLPKCRDRDDQKFLELTQRAKANILVSADRLVLGVGKKPSFPKGFEIITPQEMLKRVLG